MAVFMAEQCNIAPLPAQLRYASWTLSFRSQKLWNEAVLYHISCSNLAYCLLQSIAIANAYLSANT